MLISDGGGGYAGTDWNSKDIRYMWSAIAAQETDSHFDVVSGWKQTAHLTSTHLGQVQQYRDNLAAVWPPQKSPAAAAYIDRLDDLIASLKATHEAASANYTVFSSVAATLSSARHKLRPILEQYEANERANLAWQAAQDAKPIDPAKPAMMVFPPVAEAQQEQLNSQARVIMYDLSSTLISGQMALQKPQPYDPTDAGSSGGDQRSKPGGGRGFAHPPMIPPPEGRHVTTSGSSPSFSGPTAVHEDQLHAVTPIPTHRDPGQRHADKGPILGGVGPNTTAPDQRTDVIRPMPTPAGPQMAAPPSLIPGVIAPSNIPPIVSPPTYTPGTSRPLDGSASRPKAPIGQGANSPGGVIGGSPYGNLVGQTPVRESGSRSGGPARVNPVGGVIGSSRSADGRGVGTGSPTSSRKAGSLIPPRVLDNRDGSRRQKRWDPNNPWATDEGVPSVIMPPPEAPPIDPGPVIGFQR